MNELNESIKLQERKSSGRLGAPSLSMIDEMRLLCQQLMKDILDR